MCSASRSGVVCNFNQNHKMARTQVWKRNGLTLVSLQQQQPGPCRDKDTRLANSQKKTQAWLIHRKDTRLANSQKKTHAWLIRRRQHKPG